MRFYLFFLFACISSQAISQDTLFNKKLNNIIVTSVSKKETSAAVVNIIRNSNVVSDGLSIEFIKKTPDRTVGDALKRINGVTIQNDKFVLVRGLSDRYNLALLNKTYLPSTEPDRKAFSFDIIPSALIDNIIIAKSASANLPGDFAGGIVQITTKNVSSNFFSLGIGLSYGTVSTFKKFNLVEYAKFPQLFPSTYQFRVGSNGDRRAYSKLISSPKMKTISSMPNSNNSFSFGLKRNKLNLIVSSTYRTSYAINYTDRQDYQSSTELAYKYKDTSYSNTELLNGLANITYIGKNIYSLKTIVNYQKENSYLTRSGENYDNVQTVKSNSSNHINKLNINSQFDGKIKTLDFNLGYNLMLRDQPDYRVNPITKSLGINEPYLIAWRDTYRFWSIMNESGFNASVNKSIDKLKFGGSYLKKLRSFQARIFRYESLDILNEITNNTDKYKADFDLASSYIMYDNDFKKWKVNAGLRSEYNVFSVNTSDFSGQKVNVDREYLDFLPSINTSYNLDKAKIRLSASKTVSRAEFREVANFAYYDFVRNAQILGNYKLEKSNIYNLDLKYEYYPKSGENISIGVFGKNFIKPIEQIVADGSVPSNLLLTFLNPKSANVYGIELEVRKKINTWLDIYANTALTNSEVKVNGTKRQLQGQSNYVINSGFNFHKNNNTLNITYNRVGDRISAVGFQGYSDIFENSRDVVDLVYLRKIKKAEIKLSISDILAQPSIYYQKTKGNLIKTNNEQSISLTVNFNL